VAGEVTFQFDPPPIGCYSDIAYYTVSYRPDFTSDYQVLLNLTDPLITNWTYLDSSGVAGCYLVTATDSVGNTSQSSVEICLEYCPRYELPNVFTPDGNNLNDLFVPFPYQFVDAVDLRIFNRWGLLVFETTDPDVLWNGTTENTGEELPEGVYFYVGTVDERSLTGPVKRDLKGTIQLIR
jgi:gliding motility-associated-like protein